VLTLVDSHFSLEAMAIIAASKVSTSAVKCRFFIVAAFLSPLPVDCPDPRGCPVLAGHDSNYCVQRGTHVQASATLLPCLFVLNYVSTCYFSMSTSVRLSSLEPGTVGGLLRPYKLQTLRPTRQRRLPTRTSSPFSFLLSLPLCLFLFSMLLRLLPYCYNNSMLLLESA
jgi:hypothetical protein